MKYLNIKSIIKSAGFQWGPDRTHHSIILSIFCGLQCNMYIALLEILVFLHKLEIEWC